MIITTCPTCHTEHSWSWEEAFDKFGFDDGDGLVMTEAVASVLRSAGYAVTTQAWGLHNVIVNSLSKDGVSVIPSTAVIGYDEPRTYLPPAIIKLLDAADWKVPS